MRIEWRALAASVAMLALAAQGATANDDMQAEMREMREMMRALQDKVEAQDRRIQEQDQVLEEAGLDEGGSLSAISSFLESTDFYGSVSGTYLQDFKFENDDSGEGSVSSAFPADNYNTFALNQLWFGMDKAPTEESRGGFHVDIAYGANAKGDTDRPEVYAAYASVLLPVGTGVQVDAGELWTLIGGEVVDTTGNFNITRGVTWSLQPVNHVGMIASTSLTDEIGFAIGAVNDPFSDSNNDTEAGKGVTGQISYSGENWYAGVSGIWGSQDNGFDKDKYGMIDLLLSADPTDELSIWATYDYNWYEDTPGAYGFAGEGDDSSAHSVALAARYAVTEATGIAVRGEAVAFVLDDRNDEQVYTLTGTVDHTIVDNVMARFEVRYDASTEDIYTNNDGTIRDDQVIGMLELIYSF